LISLTTFLIVCPLVFLGGFVDSIAGGGGLISLPAYLMTGIPVHFAIGTNKLSSAMGTCISTLQFARSGYIRLKLSILAIISALSGSFIGAKLALHLSDRYFSLILLVVLPLTALYLVFKKNALTATHVSGNLTLKQHVLIMLIAVLLGVYDGFYGPGTGTFLLLCLTGIAKLPINLAAGTTKVINLTTNLTGLAVFLFNGKTVLVLGITAGIFGILGNYLGARHFSRSGAKIAKPIILAVLGLFFIKLII
jgi:uncharacterized membrane protein YfcA